MRKLITMAMLMASAETLIAVTSQAVLRYVF